MHTPPPILISTDVAERLERVLETAGKEFAAVVQGLEEELARADLCAPADMPADVVTMHSVVSFVDERTGATHEARLVYPRESAGQAGDISILSPVGAALLGLRIGQSIDWPLPGGSMTRVKVTGVKQAAPSATLS
jgi:regulator of nucleoside diphosphate kinase